MELLCDLHSAGIDWQTTYPVNVSIAFQQANGSFPLKGKKGGNDRPARNRLLALRSKARAYMVPFAANLLHFFVRKLARKIMQKLGY
jgi:hypothetical protein